MRITTLTLLPIMFALSACQGDKKDSVAASSESAADITLRATSDILTPSPIKAASFVPNNVASWLGHIILLDKKGVLHRATTDSAETDVVAIGKYADVIGLARDNNSGVFLALTPEGQVKAFVEIDNEGNFGPMAVSTKNMAFERFCKSSTPSADFIWLETKNKKPQKMSVEIFDDASIVMSEIDHGGAEDPCKANSVSKLNETHSVQLEAANTGLTLSSGDGTKTLAISNGLSIGKVKDAGFVSVTTANMGSVFNEGVILVAEKNEGRLVLISRAYALKEINKP